MEFRSLYITVGNKEEARKIASVLLEERLVACTNLFETLVQVGQQREGEGTKETERGSERE